MTCPTPVAVAYLSPFENAPAPMVPTLAHQEPKKAVPPIASNPLERLAQLMLSNDRLMDELSASRTRITDARSNLDSPGSNSRFGEAHLDRCRSRHSRILAQLRANRIEALQLLGEGGSGV
ncbi:hypothetical protein P12x_000594 [Tundrisphaera lichenicola]|uniref:hypothetical protein n=1 Tax=Tundrisphaera lichenicola TaxID=2029860 RepID=UPI003EB9D3BA